MDRRVVKLELDPAASKQPIIFPPPHSPRPSTSIPQTKVSVVASPVTLGLEKEILRKEERGKPTRRRPARRSVRGVSISSPLGISTPPRATKASWPVRKPHHVPDVERLEERKEGGGVGRGRVRVGEGRGEGGGEDMGIAGELVTESEWDLAVEVSERFGSPVAAVLREVGRGDGGGGIRVSRGAIRTALNSVSSSRQHFPPSHPLSPIRSKSKSRRFRFRLPTPPSTPSQPSPHPPHPQISPFRVFSPTIPHAPAHSSKRPSFPARNALEDRNVVRKQRRRDREERRRRLRRREEEEGEEEGKKGLEARKLGGGGDERGSGMERRGEGTVKLKPLEVDEKGTVEGRGEGDDSPRSHLEGWEE